MRTGDLVAESTGWVGHCETELRLELPTAVKNQ